MVGQSSFKSDPIQDEAWGNDAGESSRFERFLWFGAGANVRLLQRCPYSDKVKYQGLGGIVWATTVLAFASGSYAFYTIFSPKVENALDKDIHLPSALIASAVGVLWALIIFNLDRFIVSSTGKGDGTDKITWSELFQASPRIVMAVIIGVCISAPLETRILKPEIDAQLQLEQQDQEAKLNAVMEKETADFKSETLGKIKELQLNVDQSRADIEKRRLEINAKQIKLEEEVAGRSGSGKAGVGPATLALKEALQRDRDELALLRTKVATDEASALAEVSEHKRSIAAREQALAEGKARHRQQARAMDGLLKRIHISHAIGGLVPWAILLLMLSIETGPIFFKLMLTKGAYDYLSENERRLRQAYLGVAQVSELHAKGRTIRSGDAPKTSGSAANAVDEAPSNVQEVIVERFLRVERVEAEQLERLESEKQVTRKLHAKFRTQRSGEIDQNPGRFLKPDGSEEPEA